MTAAGAALVRKGIPRVSMSREGAGFAFGVFFWGGKAAETSQHGNVGPFLRTAGGASPAL